MQEIYNEEDRERVLIVGCDTGEFDVESSERELKELILTAGGESEWSLYQKRETPDRATFIGIGRLKEAQLVCENAEIDLVVCDAQLTPSQQRNMEEVLGVRVIDRTMLILDIFAASAKTSEGRLQVELAQLRYSLPRLTGKGTQLSRLGGGIGTRGPGESKLESDRRHIRRKINALEASLEKLEKRRSLHRERRKKDGVQTAAIVGYTNAGKSTLLNALTDAGVLAENKLFATLDPTSRSIKLPDGREIMLIDTVGFISRLPHNIVEAFKSTLEEAADADVILNICDASSPEYEMHLQVTREILEQLGASGKPMITVLNKCDAAENFYLLPAESGVVKISALKGIGFERLLEEISAALPATRRRVLLLIPFSQGALAGKIRREGAVNSEEYREDGLFMDVIIDVSLMHSVIEYIIDEG